MNKEQAIAVIERELLRVHGILKQTDDGSGYMNQLTGELTGLESALKILRALPDETPTVLTREKLDELIAQTEPERCANCEYAGMREASAAMDGLRDYPTVQPLCDYHEGVGRLRDALLALGPVVAEGPVQCPTNHMCTLDNQNMIYAVPWRTIIRGQLLKHCPDCGTRLQGGER